MNATLIVQRLREVLRDVRPQAAHDRLGVDDDFLRALALDSLDIGNFVVEVENDFGVQLDVAQLMKVSSLARLSELIIASPGARPNSTSDANRDDSEFNTSGASK